MRKRRRKRYEWRMEGFPKCGKRLIRSIRRKKYDFFLPEATSGNPSFKHQLARIESGINKGREGSGVLFSTSQLW
jgi:hypothetical protein